MARPPSFLADIKPLLEGFALQLTAVIEANARERAKEAVLRALGGAGDGLSAAAVGKGAVNVARKPRKKAPIQLCPVPGCKNRAAPAFGMVCSDHKGVARAKIKQYREARRKQKAVGKRPVAKAEGRTPARRLAKKTKATQAKATKKTRKAAATAKATAARQVQGQYLGVLRKLTGADRSRVKAEGKKTSVAAAVKLAAKLIAAKAAPRVAGGGRAPTRGLGRPTDKAKDAGGTTPSAAGPVRALRGEGDEPSRLP